MASLDGQFHHQAIALAPVYALLDEFTRVCVSEEATAPTAEVAAVMLYALVAGGLRTADRETRSRRHDWFVWKALEALAELAITAKFLNLDDLEAFERQSRPTAGVS